MTLRQLHQEAGATFGSVNGQEVVLHYGDPVAERMAFRREVAFLDLSFRSRLCLLGPDRLSFLHGQVTNDLESLPVGTGCYACLLNAKGKLESDLNTYHLAEELLLDFEPGLAEAVQKRLEAFIIADDVQVVDVAPHYGLLALMGPKSEAVLRAALDPPDLPQGPWMIARHDHPDLGELYIVRRPVEEAPAWHLFAPVAGLEEAARRLQEQTRRHDGRLAGWEALETSRIEAGLPRFGVDMDQRNLPPEANLDDRAISYTKGCYIGQEIIARLRTYGQVAKALRGLCLEPAPKPLPDPGATLRHEGREVGYITSALHSPMLNQDIALAYVRREHNQEGQRLTVTTPDGEREARIVPLPFVAPLAPEAVRSGET